MVSLSPNASRTPASGFCRDGVPAEGRRSLRARVHSWLDTRGWVGRALPWVLVAVLLAAITILDMLTPPTVPVAALFPLVVLVALEPRRPGLVVAAAVGATVLSIVGALVSAGERTLLGLANHAGSTITVWAVVAVGLQLLRSERRVRASLERERDLNAELDHRVRNNLAALATLVDETAAMHAGAPDLPDRLRQRIQCMLATHGVLSQSHWSAVGIDALLDAVVPPEVVDRVVRHGPGLAIDARHVPSLGIVLAELIANSRRHGSLGAPGGQVEVRWTEHALDEHGRQRVELAWTETGGPAIKAPPRPGLGVTLIRGLVGYEMYGRAELTFPPAGAAHSFDLHLERPGPTNGYLTD